MALMAANTTGPPPWPQKLTLKSFSQMASTRMGSSPMMSRDRSWSIPTPAGAA